MNRIKTALAKGYTNFAMRQCGVKPLTEKRERGDHLVEVLGTIIVAVVLLFLFRNQLKNIFTGALSSTSDATNQLFNTKETLQ